MLIVNFVYVNNGKKQIGCFKKEVEMPCVPPLGTEMFFGGSGWGFTVNRVTYSENSGLFSLNYIIDVDKEMDRRKEFFSDWFFPNMLINKMGFTVEWVEDEFVKNL